ITHDYCISRGEECDEKRLLLPSPRWGVGPGVRGEALSCRARWYRAFLECGDPSPLLQPAGKAAMNRRTPKGNNNRGLRLGESAPHPRPLSLTGRGEEVLNDSRPPWAP